MFVIMQHITACLIGVKLKLKHYKIKSDGVAISQAGVAKRNLENSYSHKRRAKIEVTSQIKRKTFVSIKISVVNLKPAADIRTICEAALTVHTYMSDVMRTFIRPIRQAVICCIITNIISNQNVLFGYR